MDIIHPFCAGMDVHKKTVVVCSITPGPKDEKTSEIRTFGSVTCAISPVSAAIWFKIGRLWSIVSRKYWNGLISNSLRSPPM